VCLAVVTACAVRGLRFGLRFGVLTAVPGFLRGPRLRIFVMAMLAMTLVLVVLIVPVFVMVSPVFGHVSLRSHGPLQAASAPLRCL
jgi:hypothetical protein